MTSIYLNEDDCQNLTSILYLCSIQDDETKDFYHKINIKILNANIWQIYPLPLEIDSTNKGD